MNHVKAGAMMPHPPIILPNIGKGEEKEIADIDKAMKEAADALLMTDPDTVVIISPHAPAYFDYMQVSCAPQMYGDMSQFRDPADSFVFEGDMALAEEINRLALQAGVPAGTLGEQDGSLDHGSLVPLYYLKDGMKECKLVRIGIGGPNSRLHYELGRIIARAAENLGRSIVVIGSGDLSHCQKAGTHYGFKPEGPAYDKEIMEIMGHGDFLELLELPEAKADAAMVCGQKPFAVLAGTMDGLRPLAKASGHSAAFGVGYGVCTYTDLVPDEKRHFLKEAKKRAQEAYESKRSQEDAYVSLARDTINAYVSGRPLPEPAPLGNKAGVFVSIHKDGKLRGCIGTTQAVTEDVSEEIMQNGISAATRDPRFPAIQPWELEDLDISVDVLQPAEPVKDVSMLDPKKYGVIVTRGSCRGLLLPDLEGVDTVEEQLRIARQKAGISLDEKGVQLERFTVVRHV